MTDGGKRTAHWIGGAVLVCLAGLTWYLATRTPDDGPQEVRTDVESSERGQGIAVEADLDHTIIGGVRRKRSEVTPSAAAEVSPKPSDGTTPDVATPDTTAKASDSEGSKASDVGIPDHGRTQPVAADASPQTEAAVAAYRNREADPEAYARAVSVLARPEAFDAKKFRTDKAYRQDYLGRAEPGRVFQTREPGEDVPRLGRVGPFRQQTPQGETAKLQVRATPGMPVTFTSFDLGRFQTSQLTSVTVVANDKGIAEVVFEATPGTIGDAHILIGSPSSSGQVKLVVKVTEPIGGSNNLPGADLSGE